MFKTYPEFQHPHMPPNGEQTRGCCQKYYSHLHQALMAAKFLEANHCYSEIHLIKTCTWKYYPV